VSIAHLLGALTVDVAIGVIVAYAAAAGLRPRRARLGWAIAALASFGLAFVGASSESQAAGVAATALFALLAALKVRLPGLADS
jgi:hypothetical protein